MINFNIKTESSPEHIKYTISGYIDEKALFPNVDLKPKISISLKDVVGLNSVGTRSWCDWVKQLIPPSIVYLDHCPLLFVKSFNQIVGSLNENMVVNSFIVPYCSEDGEEQKNVLFNRGIEYDDVGSLNLPEVKDLNGKTMELDVLMQYFEFLKK